jgi:hypothetical protein
MKLGRVAALALALAAAHATDAWGTRIELPAGLAPR